MGSSKAILGMAGTGKSRILGAWLAQALRDHRGEVSCVWFLTPVSNAFVDGFRVNFVGAGSMPPIREACIGEWAAEELAHGGTTMGMVSAEQLDVIFWEAARHAGMSFWQARQVVRAARGGARDRSPVGVGAGKALARYEYLLQKKGVFDKYAVIKEWLWRESGGDIDHQPGQVVVVDGAEQLTPVERRWLERKSQTGAAMLVSADPAMNAHEGEAGDLKAFIAALRKGEFGPCWVQETSIRHSPMAARVLSNLVAPLPGWRKVSAKDAVGETVVEGLLFASVEDEIDAIMEAILENPDIAIFSDDSRLISAVEAACLGNGVPCSRGVQSIRFHEGWELLLLLLKTMYEPTLDSVRGLINRLDFDRPAWAKEGKRFGLDRDPSKAIIQHAETVRMTEHEAAVIATWVIRARGRGSCWRLYKDIGEWVGGRIEDRIVAEAILGRMAWYMEEQVDPESVIADLQALRHEGSETTGKTTIEREEGIQLLDANECHCGDWAKVWLCGVGAGPEPGRAARRMRHIFWYKAASRAKKALTISGPEGGWATDFIPAGLRI